MWTEREYEWSGGRIHYLEAGEGPPALLLHGGAADSASRSWERAPEYLSGLRLLAPDFPGFGSSELRSERVDTPFFKSFVLDFLERLGVRETRLLGFSMGGLVAAHLALQLPERFVRLVLVGAAGLAPGIPFRPLSDLVAVFPGLHRFFYWAAGRSLILMRIGMRKLVYDPQKLPAEFVWQTRELLRSPNAGLGWRRFLQSELAGNHFRNQVSDDLEKIRVPTLLLHGRHDRLVAVDHSLLAAERISDGRVVVLENCGHWVHQEAPEQFYSEVETFFCGADGRD